MLYWKPEQPPGLTPIRRARSSSPSWAMRVLTFSAALSVMLTMVASFCSISTSRAVVCFWLPKLLHRQPYTSTPLSQGPPQSTPQHLTESRPSGRDVPSRADEQRRWVQCSQRPPPTRQALVGDDGVPVGGSYVGTFSARGIEVVRVGEGEASQRGLRYASDTC